MKKEFKVTFDEQKMAYQLDAEGFTHMEIIGMMEFYKQLYLSRNLKKMKSKKK